MSGVLKGVVLGAGGALGVMSQTDSLNDIPRNVLRGLLTGYDKVSHHHSATQNGSDPNQDLELRNLTSEIRNLKTAQESGQNKAIVIHSGGSSGSFVIKLAIVGGGTMAVLYYMGYGFDDVMYVTKTTLSKAVDVLEENLAAVGVKIEKTKNELLAKVSVVELAVTESAESLEEHLNAQTEALKLELAQMSGKFSSMEKSQEKIELNTDKLDAHMVLLQEKFEENGKELKRANEGIDLLTKSVVDLPHLRGDLVSQLRGFVSNSRSKLSSLGKTYTSGPARQTTSDVPPSPPGLEGLLGFGKRNQDSNV